MKNINDIKIENINNSQVNEILQLHLKIFDGFYGMRLGKIYNRKLITWFANDKEAVGFVAYSDNRIVGYVFGAPLGYRQRMTQHLLPYVVLGVIFHPWILFDYKFLLVIFKNLKDTVSRNKKEKNEFLDLPLPIISLVGIGVMESYQSKGVGQSLINRFQEYSKQHGFKTIRLSVHEHNDKAKKFYSNNGWKYYSFATLNSLVYYYFLLSETEE